MNINLRSIHNHGNASKEFVILDVLQDCNIRSTKVHRFYWGLASAVWNDEGDCAHLVFAPATQRAKLKVKKAAKV